MLRERSEVTAFTRDDIERLARYIASSRIVGAMWIGKMGEQTVRWTPDGGIEVVTTYQEGDINDLPPTSPPAQIAQTSKKKKKG